MMLAVNERRHPKKVARARATGKPVAKPGTHSRFAMARAYFDLIGPPLESYDTL